jgi:carboxymethylenebutenolidase
MQRIEAQLPRGTCPIHAFGSIEASAAPAVLFFPDAFGPRPAAYAVAEAIAASGWRVLMTTPFYEFLPFEPIAPTSIFEAGPERDRLMSMFGAVNQPNIDADVAALLTLAAEKLGDEAPLAAVGYCMGGRYALTAACASERVRFAGAFHASNIAPADGDGPHRRFASARGRIYVGVAGNDPTYGAEEHGRLAEALRAATPTM